VGSQSARLRTFVDTTGASASVIALDTRWARGLLSDSDIMATILLVDDEQALRKLIRESLELDGYRVLEAANGQEALETAAQSRSSIDVVITDVVMPGMSGAELIRQMRERQPGMPVVLISGWPISTRDAIDSRTLFLQKPVTYGQLARAVHRSLRAPTSHA
jgi:two-component system, cell cycle sensor histidine kinase and response regulator CckA